MKARWLPRPHFVLNNALVAVALVQAACARCAADEQGFSLHAAVRCGADERKRLERPCRYIT